MNPIPDLRDRQARNQSQILPVSGTCVMSLRYCNHLNGKTDRILQLIELMFSISDLQHYPF